MERFGTAKGKLGEALRDGKGNNNERNRHREQQAFFDETRDITVDKINILARFFKVSPLYFLLNEEDYELFEKIENLNDKDKRLATELINKMAK